MLKISRLIHRSIATGLFCVIESDHTHQADEYDHFRLHETEDRPVAIKQ